MCREKEISIFYLLLVSINQCNNYIETPMISSKVENLCNLQACLQVDERN